jgi:transposase
MTEHTTISKVSRLEVIQTGSRRRWSVEEKRRVVAESESAPRQVSATARRHGIRPSQLFMWRRLAQQGRLGGDEDAAFARAVIACEAAAVASPGPTQARIEIVLPDGVRMIVDAAIDPAVLARLIGTVERR